MGEMLTCTWLLLVGLPFHAAAAGKQTTSQMKAEAMLSGGFFMNRFC